MTFLDFLNAYSSALTFLTSLLMLIVTAIYVYFTGKQVKSSNQAIQESIKQFKESKQPCLVPEIKDVNGIAFDVTKYLRIQFGFKYTLTNVGDSPALSVYTIARMQTQYSTPVKNVVAHLMPNYQHAISVQETKDEHLHFETSEFRDILEDVEISHVKNKKRLETNAKESSFKGPIFMMTILYKNLAGQWYITEFTQELLDICKVIQDDSTSSTDSTNLNYEEIDNMSIQDGDNLIGIMINPADSHFSVKKISEERAQKIIEQNTDRYRR